MISSPAAMVKREEVEAEVQAALDLCLACKGCKAECPSGVDMAKLKFEFEHHYYETHRRPLRDYLFGYFNELARLGAPFRPIYNFLFGNRAIRNIMNPVLGLAGQRQMPRFSPKTGTAKPDGEAGPAEGVILLRDTFTHYFESEVERAALEVLAAGGSTEKVLPTFGAGRTLISKGFLEAARRQAERVLDQIRRVDPEGRLPVIGLEPSEVNTLRDEYLDLIPERREEAEGLARRVWSVEEYMLRGDGRGKKPILRIANIVQQKGAVETKKILLHGHCSQKAQPPSSDGVQVGQQASAEFLKALGREVEIIPSGCCGMAGAFGYEADHYGVSMKVGELVLFPFIQGNPDAEIAAEGTSCRAQILDGCGRRAYHPVEIAARMVKNSG